MTYRLGYAVVIIATLVLTACSDSREDGDVGEVPADRTADKPTVTTPRSATAPKLRVAEAAAGLEHGWDVGFLPGGDILVSQRPGQLALVPANGSDPADPIDPIDVAADFSDVLARGEGGLMGLVVHPDFADTRRFTTCQTHTEDGTAVDVRLVTWRLAADGESASRESTLLSGLPVNPSGRHSGCRPAFAADGTLLIGTGDTARGDLPQDRTSLGGKVLRIDPETGEAPADNPFADAADPNERLVYTYGHRNVQGVAPRPDTDQVFTAEHGPDRDDEVNLLEPGGNYGWDPSQGGTADGYDEDVPMTDLDRFPDAVPAVWRSGDTTEAICAAEFLSGKQWGELDGALVVTALNGAKLLVLTLDEAGAVESVAIPPEFTDTYGRLRAARQGPDGALYVTTTNGVNDKLLRVTLA